MTRGRPKKIKEDIAAIEKEVMAGATEVMEPVEETPGTVDDLNLSNEQGAEISDEYDIKVIRETKGVDFTYIPNPDKRYAYFYMRLKDNTKMTVRTGNLLHFGGGWKLVDKAHAERIGLGRQVGADGLCHAGDLVLGFMPKSLYEEKVSYKNRKTKSATSEIDRMLKHGKADPSLTAIHPDSMMGLQTEKQLGGDFK